MRQDMKRFWNTRAKENAPFYIATWRGHDRTDTEDFFLTGDEAMAFVSAAGYQPTGQDRMLEIGCGIGRMTHGFAALFGRVDAIDVSGEMIARANELKGDLDNVQFHETSGQDLALFEDNSMDFCFSYIVFQHIPSKDVIFNYVREAARVLKPGGIFHFQLKDIPDPDIGVSPVLLAAKRLYRRFVRRPALALRRRLSNGPHGFESPAWTGVSVTADEITSECERAGLTVQTITGQHKQYMWVTATNPG
jgi:SAM-dependent methyltransferase